jgi:hypothetical protein
VKLGFVEEETDDAREPVHGGADHRGAARAEAPVEAFVEADCFTPKWELTLALTVREDRVTRKLSRRDCSLTSL